MNSVKHHLKRVIGDSTLTYEELSTILCEVEACLNSRPLRELTNDSKDAVALTPTHLLSGKPISLHPEVMDSDSTSDVTTRWKLIQKCLEIFGKHGLPRIFAYIATVIQIEARTIQLTKRCTSAGQG